MLLDVMTPSRNSSASTIPQHPTRGLSPSRSTLSARRGVTTDAHDVADQPAVRTISARSVGGAWPIDHESLKTSTEGPTVDGDGNYYPEGGTVAWLVVFGSFIGMVAW